MLKKIVIIALALTLTACVAIPTEPPQMAECPGGYLDMLVGQSADDPIATDLPGYVDIVRVESNLNDETLTATFHLRDVPENMMFNREGIWVTAFEYLYAVNVNVGGERVLSTHRSDYTLATYYTAVGGSGKPESTALEDKTRTVLWKNEVNDAELTIYFEETPIQPELIVSHQDNTLTLVGEIPGITETSTVMFSVVDYLSGQDGVSCNSN